MISSLRLNKLILSVIFFTALILNFSFAEDEPADIWKKKENQEEQNNQANDEKDITIESPILSDDVNKIIVKIDEDKIKETRQSVIGIFDPEEHNFNLNMWAQTDGEEIKKILNLIFHNYVLIFECKYKLTIMQLGSRFEPKTNRNLIIKIILFLLVFFLGIFLLDKIDFPTPKKIIKQEISNDKFILLK